MLARREKIDFIHARTAIPGLIALGAKIFRPSMKIIFDTDGFVPEFRVEIGLLNEKGLMFKTLKKIEKLLVKKSDMILVRTQSAKNIMIDWYGTQIESKTYVTPNGKDEDFYRPYTEAQNRQIRQKYGIGDDAIFLIYVGTLGQSSMPDKMFRLFSLVTQLEPNSFFLILSRTEFDELDALAQAEGLSDADYRVESVFPSEIPPLVSAADVGISFRAETLSMRGISPLKVCEYLLCGTPAIVNSSIGDLEDLFEKNKQLGVLLMEMSDEELRETAEWVVKTAKPSRELLRQTTRQGGIKAFGLSNIKKLYENIYSKLINQLKSSDQKSELKIKNVGLLKEEDGESSNFSRRARQPD